MNCLDRIKSVATKHGVGLVETSNGVYIVELPKLSEYTPLLVSADDGHTWCPETMHKDRGASWGGRICLRGEELCSEIKEMYNFLHLGNPSIMLGVANDLTSDQLESTGKLFS